MSITKFFLICSGADLKILERCPVENNKYVGIGATVFYTGFFAFLAGSYALYTVFRSSVIAALFGLVWGTMIFNLDRFIVSSMKKEGRFWMELRVASPRLVLALLLAVVISKPLELKIFEREINAELILMEQSIFKEQEDLVKARYLPQIDVLRGEINGLKAEIAAKEKLRDEQLIASLQEADGTGGSMKANLGPIYKIKRVFADMAQRELDDVMMMNQPIIDAKMGEVRLFNDALMSDLTNLGRDKYDGLAARLYALNNIAAKSRTIDVATWFILFLFIAIETAPMFVKIVSSKGPYDDLLKVEEHSFEVVNLEQIARLDHQLKENVKFMTNGVPLQPIKIIGD